MIEIVAILRQQPLGAPHRGTGVATRSSRSTCWIDSRRRGGPDGRQKATEGTTCASGPVIAPRRARSPAGSAKRAPTASPLGLAEACCPPARSPGRRSASRSDRARWGSRAKRRGRTSSRQPLAVPDTSSARRSDARDTAQGKARLARAPAPRRPARPRVRRYLGERAATSAAGYADMNTGDPRRLQRVPNASRHNAGGSA